MGLNAPKRYLILMANNYELRMSGGFNTYVVVAEFNQGIPQITYSIDTYFIDEGERTGSSFLVSRNVPYFLGSIYIFRKEVVVYTPGMRLAQMPISQRLPIRFLQNSGRKIDPCLKI